VGDAETSLDDDVEWGERWRGVWPYKAGDPWAAGVVLGVRLWWGDGGSLAGVPRGTGAIRDASLEVLGLLRGAGWVYGGAPLEEASTLDLYRGVVLHRKISRICLTSCRVLCATHRVPWLTG
jgi:hypothetical protein